MIYFRMKIISYEEDMDKIIVEVGSTVTKFDKYDGENIQI